MTTCSENIPSEHRPNIPTDQREDSDDYNDNRSDSEDQRNNPKHQSAEEEAQAPRPVPATRGYEKEASSLAYSQSGAKTEADNTISDPSAFGEFHSLDGSLTTTQKTEMYPWPTDHSSSSSSRIDVVQSKSAEDHHQCQKEEKRSESNPKEDKAEKYQAHR